MHKRVVIDDGSSWEQIGGTADPDPWLYHLAVAALHYQSGVRMPLGILHGVSLFGLNISSHEFSCIFAPILCRYNAGNRKILVL